MSNLELLAAARTELTWSSRLLSAAADAKLEKTPDDSHSNLGWDSEKQAITGRVGAHIHVPTFTLHHGNDSLKLHGCTLDEGLRWLGEKVGAPLSLRVYDAPTELKGGEEPLTPDLEQLTAISKWFTFAASVMSDLGELRIWPHHFDLGFFQDKVLGDKGSGTESIGGGFTIGDVHYEFPYFYVNPYGAERPVEPPSMTHGSWTDKWFGAVLTLREFDGDGGTEVASKFMSEAMRASLAVLTSSGKAADS